jgi:hypothetical protein
VFRIDSYDESDEELRVIRGCNGKTHTADCRAFGNVDLEVPEASDIVIVDGCTSRRHATR